MKRLFFLLLTLFLLSNSFAQSKIDNCKYWFDDDHVNAISTFIDPSEIVNFNADIDASSLSAGIHRFSIRFKDESGSWSSTISKYFYRLDQNIAGYEYWFDNNYAGKINQTVAPSIHLDLSQTINADDLKSGYHSFNIRFKEANGLWSETNSGYFIKLGDNNSGELITAYRYWFDNAPNTMVVVPVATPASFIQINDSLNVLSQLGPHTINIQFKDNSQLWSAVSSYNFSNCPDITGGVKANFNLAISGTNVSFVNTSQNVTSYKWDFGGGLNDTSNAENPLHHYPSTPGTTYNACLISKNSCLLKSDTICKTSLSLWGLKSINTNHGGNTGEVSVNITGGGFVDGMQLYLHKNGEADISGDTLIISDAGSMSTTFDLRGKVTGLWDVIAVFPGSNKDTLHNGFAIEQGDSVQLWINITGDEILRIGFNQIYTITYGNKSNCDALLVPLGIDGLPLGTDIEVINPLFKLDSLPGFDTLNLSDYHLNYTINDSLDNSSYRLFYIDRIPPGATGSIQFIFHVPMSTPLHSLSNIKIALGDPMISSSDFLNRKSKGLNTTNTLNADEVINCSAAMSEAAIGELVDKVLSTDTKYDLSGVTTCVNGLVKNKIGKVYESFVKHIVNGREIKHQSWYGNLLDFSDQALAGLITANGCIRTALTGIAGVGATFVQIEIVLPAVIGINWSMRIQMGLNKASEVVGALKLLKDCNASLKNIKRVAKKIIFGNAPDPNEKFGTGDNSAYHFTSSIPLTYTIGFENDTSSNLNAQTITVTDTLNPAFYNFSSFGFTSITLGKKFIILPNSVTSFYHDFDFIKECGVKARVTGTFDTITGIAQWKFLTIDPATGQVTTNALTGFLPPDIVSPEGQGYVSFIVDPKKNIQTGDTVSNKASITFDYNPPIITNNWLNTFDFVKPNSTVESLPKKTFTEKFPVKWNGTDNLSGVSSYDIYVSVNDSSFKKWRTGIALNIDTFSGVFGNKYSFYSIATDNAENTESAKSIAEARTFLMPLEDTVCLGDIIKIASNIKILGAAYQWQEYRDTSGYKDIANAGVYSGVTADTLQLTNLPSSFNKYRFRCVITNQQGQVVSYYHIIRIINNWTGAISTEWENSANWNCGSVPDEYTDVIIKQADNQPVINSDKKCRSIKQDQGTRLNLNPNFHLIITGPTE